MSITLSFGSQSVMWKSIKRPSAHSQQPPFELTCICLVPTSQKMARCDSDIQSDLTFLADYKHFCIGTHKINTRTRKHVCCIFTSAKYTLICLTGPQSIQNYTQNSTQA